MDRSADLRAVARIVVDDLSRGCPKDRIALDLPDATVMSDMDPDTFAILCRNLVENALRHGAENTTVDVALTADGLLSVANDGPVLTRDTLDRLTARFERANASADGSGLGLAIVAAISGRIGSSLVLESPRPGTSSGFQASLRLPTEVPDPTAKRDT